MCLKPRKPVAVLHATGGVKGDEVSLTVNEHTIAYETGTTQLSDCNVNVSCPDFYGTIEERE